MSGERLAGLLALRLREEGIGGDATVSVAELRRQLLPYPYCRERLELASKAEYDLAMLDMLGDPNLLGLEDSELREAVAREVEEPEPGLGFLEDFAASHVRPGPALAERVAAGDGGNGGRPADIGPAGGERPVRLVDEEDEEDGSAPSGVGAPAETRPADAEGVTGEPSDAGPGPGAGTASPDSCRGCGGDLPPRDDLRFCPWCGADQQARSCEGCGAELESTWKFCPECGEAADA